MNHDLEKQVRDALRPVEPVDDLAARVLARIEAESRIRKERRRPWRLAWIPASLAASMSLIVVGHYQWQQHREEQALKAKQQLIEALRVTSAKLDLAYQAVHAKDRES
jgi:hypothetical protein